MDFSAIRLNDKANFKITFLTHLKEHNFAQFKGYICELMLGILFLQNALSALEKVLLFIFCYNSLQKSWILLALQRIHMSFL